MNSPGDRLESLRQRVKQLEKKLVAAQRKSMAASERRRALPPGTSRARVTTANARWGIAAEERDRVSDLLDLTRQQLADAEQEEVQS